MLKQLGCRIPIDRWDKDFLSIHCSPQSEMEEIDELHVRNEEEFRRIDKDCTTKHSDSRKERREETEIYFDD